MKKLAKAMVVPVRQRTQYTCVPCSLMMCLKALGMDWLDEDTVNDVMGARPMKGATWEQVVATAQHFGKRATFTAPCTLTQMKEWTDQGIPVMIAWNPEGRDWSHASVVFDVSEDGQVSVADPNIPDPNQMVRVLSASEFYKAWYEKWPKYLVRRPAVAISHEVSEEGLQLPPPNLRMASKKSSGCGHDHHHEPHESKEEHDYMSVQNINDAAHMAYQLAEVIDGKDMEDWVEDKISVVRAALSDLHRYYFNGRKASVQNVADRYLMPKTATQPLGELWYQFSKNTSKRTTFEVIIAWENDGSRWSKETQGIRKSLNKVLGATLSNFLKRFPNLEQLGELEYYPVTTRGRTTYEVIIEWDDSIDGRGNVTAREMTRDLDNALGDALNKFLNKNPNLN